MFVVVFYATAANAGVCRYFSIPFDWISLRNSYSPSIIECGFNPFMPTAQTFALRETDVSQQNGATSGAPLKPPETIVLWEHYRLCAIPSGAACLMFWNWRQDATTLPSIRCFFHDKLSTLETLDPLQLVLAIFGNWQFFKGKRWQSILLEILLEIFCFTRIAMTS